MVRLTREESWLTLADSWRVARVNPEDPKPYKMYKAQNAFAHDSDYSIIQTQHHQQYQHLVG